ncbi:MAG TPA: glycosyltransferase family 4 protein [Candidatus Campbellbacteria bacterium]|nr:glycosyltransferase family 4 protein [Candidatus Campbellbacteria bacterium]
MKIAIFSDNFYPEISGISDSIIALAKKLAESGNKITFFAPRYSDEDYKKVKIPSGKELDLGENIRIKRYFSFHYPLSGTGQAHLVTPSPWRWRFSKSFVPDVIHSQLFFGLGLDALISARINHIPIVGTNHTAIAEFTRYSPIKAGWFEKITMKYVVWYYNHCDYVTAPSQSVFDEMARFGFKRPHKVMSNPVSFDIFNTAPSSDKEKLKKEFGFSNAVLACAGRLSPEKNVDVIIRALALVRKRIPDINLVLAGHGNAAGELKNLAENLGVSDAVKFFGTVDQPTLAKIYRAAEIFVIGSTSETQSMSLIQAMACALPAVGVSARALPEYITNQTGFLVKPNDYEAFAEKIIFLIKNPAFREKLGENASKFVQKFSVPNIAEEWEKIYGEITCDKL